jgi:hypothetical protein
MYVELWSKFEHKRNYCVEVWEQQFAKVDLLALPYHALIIVAIENGAHH